MEIFSDSAWQMTLGERAAIEGVLVQRKPELAIKIGVGDGGSLRRVATHSGQAHSFEPSSPPASAAELSNVTHHTGDWRQLLPPLLEELVAKGRNVDFVLVEGDYAADDARRVLDDLLSSPALADTVILVHNTANEQVRTGVDAVRYTAYPKVAHVNLDLVPGHLLREPARAHQLWGGLGLVVVDATRTAYFPAAPVIEDRYYEAGHLYPEMRDLVAAREQGKPASPAEAREQRKAFLELTDVREERDHYKGLYESLIGSSSWKLTAPLRLASARARRGS